MLFFDWDIRTAKNKEGIVRALSSNEPIVRVVHAAGWAAKNRVGLTEPLKPEFTALAPLFGTAEACPGADGVPPAAAPAAVQTPAAPPVSTATPPPQEDAHQAYVKAARALHGESSSPFFAYIGFMFLVS